MADESQVVEQIVASLKRFAWHMLASCRDLIPIILVISIFQLLVVRKPFPEIFDVVIGLVFVIFGLALLSRW